ncbi:hypothetical protein SNE40_017458 [Patella caerulea]|uniref:Uncharacterized protein n=1 Tax=Patella caerulea TaxID=87958 RepID=A0AAN8JF38_PATCE
MRCENVLGGCGLNVALSNGIQTDTSWKCSDERKDGWENVNFDDSDWRNAKLLPFWIWTIADINAFGVIYCRKSFNSTMTHRYITGHVYCRDTVEFYADGVRYQHDNDNKGDVASPINIPGSTRLIAIRCENWSWTRGLNVNLSNGVRSDASWKCSDEEEDGWNTVSFNDSSWRNAELIDNFNTYWIWTTEDAYDSRDTIYCRKFIGAPSFDHRSINQRNASYSKSNVVNNTVDPNRFFKTIYTSRKMGCSRACTENADCRRYLYCSSNSLCNLYQDGGDCFMSGDKTGCSCYTQNIRCEDSDCTCPSGKYGEGCQDTISGKVKELK